MSYEMSFTNSGGQGINRKLREFQIYSSYNSYPYSYSINKDQLLILLFICQFYEIYIENLIFHFSRHLKLQKSTTDSHY